MEELQCGNPWIFEEILTGKKRNISSKEKLDVIKEHIELATKMEKEVVAIPKLRKHIAWYLKGIKGSSEVKNKINKCDNKQEMINILEDFLK